MSSPRRFDFGEDAVKAIIAGDNNSKHENNHHTKRASVNSLHPTPFVPTTILPPQPVSIHVGGNLVVDDDDDKEEVMVLTRQQNNEKFLKKQKAKISQIAKLTEQVEDLKWQLFYGNSEKDKEVKQIRHMLVLKDQELEELRAMQLSALADPLRTLSPAISSSRPVSSIFLPPSQSEVTQLYASIVQVLQHQGLIMRHLSCIASAPPPTPHAAVSERLDLIERDVNAQISAVLGEQVGAISAPSLHIPPTPISHRIPATPIHLPATPSLYIPPTPSLHIPTSSLHSCASPMSMRHIDSSIATLLQRVDVLIAKQENEVSRKEQKRLQKERDHQLQCDGLASNTSSGSHKTLALSLATVACGVLYLLSTTSRFRRFA